jgi:hypothetical protein
LRQRLIPEGRWRKWLIRLLILTLAGVYFIGFGGLHDPEVQIGFTITYMSLALLASAVLSTATITQEKEAGTWEAVLATPLSGGTIVFAKCLGAMNRAFRVGLLLFGHLALVAVAGYLHPMTLVLFLPAMLGPMVFLIGTGILIGTLVRRTVAGLILNVGLAVILWLGIPFVAALSSMAMQHHRSWQITLLPNPLVMNVMIVDGLDRRQIKSPWRYELSSFDLPYYGHIGFSKFVFLNLCVSGIYLLMGVVALIWAGRRLRRG